MVFGIRTIVGLSLLVVSTMCFAQSKVEYFRATVPVKSQLSSERQRAAEEAFKQVLVRMSGSEVVLQHEYIQQKVKRAPNYIEQFQYLELDSPELEEQGYREMLSLAFSPTVVRKLLLDEAQLPFWSVNRPNTLVWLVEDNPETGKQLLNQQSDSPVIKALAEAGLARGLPLSYPLLDLDDQLTLSPEDVWAVDEAAIVEASARYGADVILVGRFSQTSRDELWSIWQYFHAGVTSNYDSRVSLEEDGAGGRLGEEALFPLADFLADRYAIQPQYESAGRLVMQVSGVENFGAYRRSLNYLEGLAAVSGVQIAAVRQDTMLLYLESEASIDKLVSVLALDNKLRVIPLVEPIGPVWQQAPQGTLENPLRYSWSS